MSGCICITGNARIDADRIPNPRCPIHGTSKRWIEKDPSDYGFPPTPPDAPDQARDLCAVCRSPATWVCFNYGAYCDQHTCLCHTEGKEPRHSGKPTDQARQAEEWLSGLSIQERAAFARGEEYGREQVLQARQAGGEWSKYQP